MSKEFSLEGQPTVVPKLSMPSNERSIETTVSDRSSEIGRTFSRGLDFSIVTAKKQSDLSLEKYTEIKSFFSSAFAEVTGKEIPAKIGTKKGKYFEGFLSIADEVKKQLSEIGDYPPQLLNPFVTMDQKSLSTYTNLGKNQRDAIDYFRKIKVATEKKFASQVAKDIDGQSLPRGLLTTPRYYYREGEKGDINGRDCFASCFRMVLAEIIGRDVPRGELNKIASTAHLFEDNSTYSEDEYNIVKRNKEKQTIPDDVLLGTLQTEAFKKISGGKRARITEFVGADFDDIAEYIGKSKSALQAGGIEDAQFFYIPQIASIEIPNGIHRVVLNNVYDYGVYFHDPSNSITDSVKGEERRYMSKDEYSRRSGQAQLRGHLISAYTPPPMVS
jgi:hypothetical protein